MQTAIWKCRVGWKAQNQGNFFALFDDGNEATVLLLRPLKAYGGDWLLQLFASCKAGRDLAH